MMAFAWRGGQIEFGRRVTCGAMKIASAPARQLRPAVEVVARHAYDGKTLLVPGVPEADDEQAAFSALKAFREQVAKRLAVTAPAEQVPA